MVNKVMTWVVIMTLLISQSYAYASIPCEPNIDDSSVHDMHIGALTMTHHGMLESAMSNDMQQNTQQDSQQHKLQNVAMECCEQQCSCPNGACASVTLTDLLTATSLKLEADSSSFYLFSIQDTFLASSRKPPIIG